MKWKLSNLIGILAIAMIVLFALPAIANAPPPPPMNWFKLSYSASQPTLQSLQIVECNTATCEPPTLFIQYGECLATGCLKPDANISASAKSYRFDCADNRCLLINEVNTFPSNQPKTQEKTNRWFRLIGQFSDRLRLSSPILKDSQEQNTSFPYSGFWQVQVTNDSLQVIQEKNKHLYSIFTPLQEYTSQMFLTGWLLTISSELLIASLFLWWRKASQQKILRALVAIAMVNLFSYPVVWSFFPSLEPFQILLGRYFGISSFIVSLLYGLIMYGRRKDSSKKIIFVSLLTFIGLNITGGFIALWFGYGNRLPIAEGIPYRFTMPISEVFAVVYEAWLIATLSLGQLTLKQSGILSLITNATSLIFGLILFGTSFLT
jgi:hypothetical protein